MKMMTGFFGYLMHMQSRSYDNFSVSVSVFVCLSVTMIIYPL